MISFGRGSIFGIMKPLLRFLFKLKLKIRDEISNTCEKLGRLYHMAGVLLSGNRRQYELETQFNNDPSDSMTTFELALLYKGQGNVQRARQLFERLSNTICPHRDAALDQLEQLRNV